MKEAAAAAPHCSAERTAHQKKERKKNKQTRDQSIEEIKSAAPPSPLVRVKMIRAKEKSEKEEISGRLSFRLILFLLLLFQRGKIRGAWICFGRSVSSSHLFESSGRSESCYEISSSKNFPLEHFSLVLRF